MVVLAGERDYGRSRNCSTRYTNKITAGKDMRCWRFKALVREGQETSERSCSVKRLCLIWVMYSKSDNRRALPSDFGSSIQTRTVLSSGLVSESISY